MRLFRILFIGLILQSCATQKKSMADILNTWIGSDKHTLIMQWGPPTQTTSDGGTGEILVYAKRIYYVYYGQPVDYWDYKMMYVDAEGKIYHWLYRKSPNPPERVDLRVLTQ